MLGCSLPTGSEHPSIGFYRRLLAFYEPEGALNWLRLPHRAFKSLTALQMIDSGRAAEVDAEINLLESGAYR